PADECDRIRAAAVAKGIDAGEVGGRVVGGVGVIAAGDGGDVGDQCGGIGGDVEGDGNGGEGLAGGQRVGPGEGECIEVGGPTGAADDSGGQPRGQRVADSDGSRGGGAADIRHHERVGAADVALDKNSRMAGSDSEID